MERNHPTPLPNMMIPKTLVLIRRNPTLVGLCLFCILTGGSITVAQSWYQQDFDQLENGDLADQDGWSMTWSDGAADFPQDISHTQSSLIQEQIKFGDRGKSVRITEQTMTLRRFVGDYDGIQYLALRFRYQSGTAPFSLYIGGSSVKWWSAVCVSVEPDGEVMVYNGDLTSKVDRIKLGHWHQLHLILDFEERTFSCYLNDKLVARDYKFRGENTRLVRNASNPRLDWIHFGRHKRDEKLVAYLDDLELGAGPGGVYFASHKLEGKLRQVLNKQPFDLISKTDLAQVETLDLSRFSLSDLTGLEHCANLKSLHLRDNRLSDISRLAPMTNLIELDLSRNQIQDLAPCQSMLKLEKLLLSDNQIQDISFLAELGNLGVIDLEQNQVTDVAPLENLLNLKRLNLNRNQVQDVVTLKNLSKLEHLYLKQNQVNDLMPLTALAKLSQLNLAENQVGEIEAVSGLINLKRLNLSTNQVKQIEALANLRQLTELILDNNQIEDLASLQNLSHLKVLYLHDNQIESIQPLENLRRLVDLKIDQNKIYDLEPLVKNQGLSGQVSVQGNELSNVSSTTYIPILIKSRRITVIHDALSPEAITFRDARLEAEIRQAINAKTEPLDLQTLSKLTEFDLSEKEAADPFAFRPIQDLSGLEFCRNLTILNLNGELMPPAGASHFDISVLEGLGNLEYLELSNNQIRDLGPLRNLVNLSTLILSRNQIAETASLVNLDRLTTLDLSQNQIADPLPGQKLPLAQVSALEILDLSQNQISDLSPFSSLTNLRELDLSQCQISDISPLQPLTNLIALNLSNNQIQDLNPLAKLLKLGSFDGSSNRIVDLQPLTKLENLTSTLLSHNQISQIHPLANNINLSGELDLRQNLLNNTAVTTYLPLLEKNKVEPVFDAPEVEPAIFADDNFEAVVRQHLEIPLRLLTAEDLEKLVDLKADTREIKIHNIVGLDQCPNLLSLEIRGWHDDPLSDLTPLSELEQLTELILWGQQVSDLAPLEKLVSLKKLNFGPNRLDQTTDLSVLRNLVNLTELGIRHNHIVDLSFLEPLRDLQILKLEQNRISEISVLENLKELSHLGLNDNLINDISALSGLPDLNWLELQNNRVTDITPLIENQNLKGTLKIHGNPLANTAQMTHIPSLRQRGIDISHDRISEQAVVFKEVKLENAIRRVLQIPVAPLTQADLLRLTELDANALDIVDLTGLEYCPNLTKLKMSWNFKLVDISNLANLKKLRYLSLHYNQVSDLLPIAELSQLTYLGIDGNPISDLSPVRSLTNLQRLDFNNSDLFADLSSLTSLQNLQILTLDNQQLRDLTPLRQLSGLRVLRLGSNWIHDLDPLLETIIDGAQLELEQNPLHNVAYTVQIPQLQARKIEVKFDAPPPDIVPIVEPKIERLIRNTLQIDFGRQPFGALTTQIVEPIQKLDASNLGLVEINPEALKALPNLQSINLTNNPLSQTALVEQVKVLEATGITVELGGLATETVALKALAKDGQLPADPNSRTLVTVWLADAKQQPVKHETVILTTSQGIIQSIAENRGDGTYTAVYTVGALDKDSVEQVTIEATTRSKQKGQLTLALVNRPITTGDINHDQRIDIQDLVLVANNFGQSGEYLLGDLNFDQSIDLFDLTLVAQNLGGSSAAPVLLETFSLPLKLYQNYPNPFNPETWIPFETSQPSTVRLEIYDVSGRRIQTISLGHVAPGYYLDRQSAIYWDGRSTTGEPVSSGIYFYSLVVNQQRLTKQMMVLK